MKRVFLTIWSVILILISAVSCGPSAPVADFQASNVTGEAPIIVQFTDLSEGDIDAWEWDFNGDGKVDSTLPNPQHEFTRACNCTVSLTVKGPGGEDFKKLQLRFDPTPVKANFVTDVTEGVGRTSVKFTDLSTGEINRWEWDFNGDETIDSTEQNPSYRYVNNGNFTVTLSIFGPYGHDTIVKENYIHITGCPT